jgi:hypothetical protein
MIIDKNLAVATAQSPTQVGTTASEDYIDTLGAVWAALGGFPIWWLFHCSAAPTSGGAATIQFIVQTADDAAFNTNCETVLASAVMDYDDVAANTIPFKAQMPVQTRRYLRGAWTIGTAVLTAGTFNVYVSAGVDVG